AFWTMLEDGRTRYFISIDDTHEGVVYSLKRDGMTLPLESSKEPEHSTAYVKGRLDDPMVLKEGEFELNHRNLHIYPNPSNGTFNYSINSVDDAGVIIQLVDMQGNIIWMKEQLVEGAFEGEIRVTRAPGVYTLRVIFDEGTAESKLIIIK
ncbi:MAG: T9SS type A sorting domain-containing protein, partial [Imperialibacter sp.]